MKIVRKLHPSQKRLLEILKKNHGEQISMRMLQDILEASSPSVIYHHIVQLEKKGYLRRNPSNPQDYQVLADHPEKNIAYLNIYGMAQCGPNGTILDGNPIDRIPISSKILGFPAHNAFIVKARGNSMSPKINNNDLAIAKRVSDVDSGDVAVCVNNGEALIKKIQKIKKGKDITYNLISINRNFSPFAANTDFRIEGIVRGIISYSI